MIAFFAFFHASGNALLVNEQLIRPVISTPTGTLSSPGATSYPGSSLGPRLLAGERTLAAAGHVHPPKTKICVGGGGGGG